jgi:hypothetical protein
VTGKERVPGVVTMITDRSTNIYENATGEPSLGSGQPMTTDRLRHLLDHQGDHWHGDPAMRRGRQARP